MRNISKILLLLILSLSFSLISSAFAADKPTKVDLQHLSFDEALKNFGLMTDIYSTGDATILCTPIGDNTGVSQATGGAIPRDVTKIVETSLNNIGGHVTLATYDPALIQNLTVTGFSEFANKRIPDVFLKGGITMVGFDAKKPDSITVTMDFFLSDFKTLVALPNIQTFNTVKMNSKKSAETISIELSGVNLEIEGQIRTLEGKHGAIRPVVQASMIELLGRYLVIPYWRVLPGAHEDSYVIETLKKNYKNSNTTQKILFAQEQLFLHGYDVAFSGALDKRTMAAFKKFKSSINTEEEALAVGVITKLYLTVPLTDKAYERREVMDSKQ